MHIINGYQEEYHTCHGKNNTNNKSVVVPKNVKNDIPDQ